jgi:type IV pilus assembly protein PilA
MCMKRDEKGFTLIELMIVIAIIGILAAIAIPQFNAYRARSYNASANSDLRNMITAQEGYFVDNNTYAQGTGAVDRLRTYGYTPSDGVVTSSISITGGATSYSISGVYNSKADTRAMTYSVTGPGGTITH